MRYLRLEEVLELHRLVIAQSGGGSGVRDTQALDSALAQPRMTFDGVDLYPTIVEKASALGFSLIMNHPFVDGNKRIGHAAMETFCVLNDHEIAATTDEQERVVLDLASGRLGKEGFTEWVRAISSGEDLVDLALGDDSSSRHTVVRSRAGREAMSVADELEVLFPGHHSPDRIADWDALKQRLAPGQAVTGPVVAKSPFGAWIDLGVGFPALLEIIVIADLTPEKYRAGDWCPVGSEVTAFLGGFRDGARQVYLWQVPVEKQRA